MQKDITSPRKIAKKARKIYDKEMKKSAQEMGRLLGNFMKPKPKWVPWKLWMFGLGIFIKIKK